MYATLGTYDLHDPKCSYSETKEHFGEIREHFTPNPKIVMIDTPELRRKRRGGRGIDMHICQPYDPESPYRYMFDPHYNKYPYDPDYKVVDGEDDGKRYLNVPTFSYPDAGSTTRVRYCDAPPKIWELCDDEA